MGKLTVEIDNFGDRVIRHDGCVYRLTPRGVSRTHYESAKGPLAPNGQPFITPHTRLIRSRFADQVRAAIEASVKESA